MAGFVKLDAGILNSSLWVERDHRSLFVTALLMAEPFELASEEPQLHCDRIEPTGWMVPPGWYGIVRASGSGIVRKDGIADPRAGLLMLTALGSPDPESRSSEYEGRRLVRINGGYLVLNFFKYRDYDHAAAERMRRLRERRRQGSAPTAATQQGRCACCHQPFDEPHSRFVVQDHDHKTGKMRGLVCQSCNKCIGIVENGRVYHGHKMPLIRAYLHKFGSVLELPLGDLERAEQGERYANTPNVRPNVTYSREQIAEGSKRTARTNNTSNNGAHVANANAPFVDRWTQEFGKGTGTAVAARLGKALKRLRKFHSDATLLDQLDKYLRQTPVDYATPQGFEKGCGSWTGTRRNGKAAESRQERGRAAISRALQRRESHGEPENHREVPGTVSRALPNPRTD